MRPRLKSRWIDKACREQTRSYFLSKRSKNIFKVILKDDSKLRSSEK